MMSQSRSRGARRYIAIALTAALVLVVSSAVSTAGPPEDDPHQKTEGWVGLVSTTADCLAVDAGKLNSTSATVRLQWEGKAEEAYLVLSAAGSERGHGIYLNGRPVGTAPIRPGGLLCRPGAASEIVGPVDRIPVPVQALRQGENVVTLTNDADGQDGWTAARVYLEIHGVLSGPPPAALEPDLPAEPQGEELASTPVWGSVSLQSSYELARGRDIWQVVYYQVPGDYTGAVAVPLVVGLHGMGGTGETTREFLAAEADARGWLLAAPDLHGSYYVNSGQYSMAWPGAQHDVMDTIAYMVSHYMVDPVRIYVVGGSMGGQTSTMMALKYPDVFAAAVAWKPLTDLGDWYDELGAMGDPYNVRPALRNETGGTPVEIPFAYERRSPLEMPQNGRRIPLKMWHDVDDQYVPVHHSRDLRDAINAWSPVTPVLLIEIASGEHECPAGSYEHCYDPDLVEVFDYLAGFASSSQPPLSVTVRTDESKPYYWLNIALTGGDHWSQVQAGYGPAGQTVTTTVTDAQPLALGYNLGSAPTVDTVGISRAGMGLPATTYLIKGGGQYGLEQYVSGHLTVTLTATGTHTMTISAITVQASADPDTVSAVGSLASTISALVVDRLGNAPPDGTEVEFSSADGIFANGLAMSVSTTVAGQATTVFYPEPAADLAEVTAVAGSVSDSASVDVIHPSIEISIAPDRATVYSGQVVLYTYTIANSGDTPLYEVKVVDDILVCSGIYLAPGAGTTCSRSATVIQTTTNTATASGQDILDESVSDDDSCTVTIISPAIAIDITSDRSVLYVGETVTFTYHLTNTGTAILTEVMVVDDNGSLEDSDDDIIVCQDITMASGEARACTYSTTLTLPGIITRTAVVTGRDPLENVLTDSDVTSIAVRRHALYLPVVRRGD